MNFPETLNDITLKRYQDFSKIEEPTNEDLIKSLLGLNDSQLNRFKASEVDQLIIHFQNLLQQETPFIPTFNLNGIKYGFIPDLDNITYGENKDLTSYINNFDTMHKAMAVAYRPVTISKGSNYIIEDYEGSHKYSETMKDAPLDVVLGMIVFFCNLTNALLKAIPNYLEKEMEKQIKIGQISELNGEIITKYTRSLRGTLEDLTQLQKCVYTLV